MLNTEALIDAAAAEHTWLHVTLPMQLRLIATEKPLGTIAVQMVWAIASDSLEYPLSGITATIFKHVYFIYSNAYKSPSHFKRKRKRSDSVPWQKPPHQQKCQKGKVTTQTTPQKSSIKQRLRTDPGRPAGVTTATQLVWLTGSRAHLPTNRNSRPIKRTHV